jgi:hypothetical protein
MLSQGERSNRGSFLLKLESSSIGYTTGSRPYLAVRDNTGQRAPDSLSTQTKSRWWL